MTSNNLLCCIQDKIIFEKPSKRNKNYFNTYFKYYVVHRNNNF